MLEMSNDSGVEQAPRLAVQGAPSSTETPPAADSLGDTRRFAPPLTIAAGGPIRRGVNRLKRELPSSLWGEIVVVASLTFMSWFVAHLACQLLW
jgi:hypothetical protein